VGIGYDKYLPCNSLRCIIRLIITVLKTPGKNYLFYQIQTEKEDFYKKSNKKSVLSLMKGFSEFAGEHLLIARAGASPQLPTEHERALPMKCCSGFFTYP